MDVPDEVRRIYSGEIRLCREPVFIVGAPRSGTTALAWALARHRDFWTSAETLILDSLFGDGRIDREIQRWLDRPSASWLRAENVGRPEFLAYLGVGLNALFTSRSGGKRWIDHTPHHVFMVDVLAEMFPGASFLHVLRDGRAAVHSMLNIEQTLGEDKRARMRDGDFLPEWSRSFLSACVIWQYSVDAAMAACERHPDRCLSLSYAELATAPERAFRELLDFLDARYEDGPAEHWRRRDELRARSSFSAEAAGEAMLASGRRRWAEWSPEERATFAEVAGATMVKHGLAREGELDAST
jgi:hypothetical protein